MRHQTFSTTALLLAALLTAPALRAQGKKMDKRPPQTRTNSDRWQRLDPAKRSQIEKIYQQLRTLPAEKQKQLLDKLRRMQPEERRTALRDARHKLTMPPHERELQKKHNELLRQSWSRLHPEEQKRLMEMKPEARKKRLHERFMPERARIVARLPEDLRQRVLAMAAPQQADFLRKHKAKATSERIFKAEEIVRLRSLDHKQLRRLFHPPHKDAPPPAQKPDFLADSSWKKWNALRPYERPRVVGFILGNDRRRPQNGTDGRRSPPGRRPGPDARPPGQRERRKHDGALRLFDRNGNGKLEADERKAADEHHERGKGAARDGQRKGQAEGPGPRGETKQRPPGNVKKRHRGQRGPGRDSRPPGGLRKR
jgi:hypothetical protein